MKKSNFVIMIAILPSLVFAGAKKLEDLDFSKKINKSTIEKNMELEDISFNGLWIPHLSWWIWIPILLIHSFKTLICFDSPACEEQDIAIFSLLKSNRTWAFELMKGKAWNIFIAERG